MDVKLEVKVDSELVGVVPDAVSFETGATREQAADPTLFVYEHHGEQFGWADPGALPFFFEDLLLGRPFPLTFATPKITDVDTLVAIALFLNRDLVVHPQMPAFVSAVDFVHRRGAPALAHIDEDLGRFLSMLRGYFPDTGLTKREIADRIQNAIAMIRDYIFNDVLPHIAIPSGSRVRVLDAGTNGFVLAETTGPLVDGWIRLYRLGYRRGILVGPDKNDRRVMMMARKSHYIAFDLPLAANLLNRMEAAMGELPTWETDGFWLKSPPEGTLILVSHIVEVLLRV